MGLLLGRERQASGQARSGLLSGCELMKGMKNYELGKGVGSSSTQIFSGGSNLILVLAAGGVGRSPSAQLNLGLLLPTDLGEGKQRCQTGYKPKLEHMD